MPMECAVLFADVAGSTALYELLGDEPAFALVEDCLATMSACTTDCHGRVVKTIGDAVMAVFDRADDAAAAAAEMQVRVAGLGEPRGVQLGVRIGFHFGPVVPRDGDVFGDSVNLASRLCDLASKGQVITDEETARQLSSLHAANLRTLFPIEVKGKAQEIALLAQATAHGIAQIAQAIELPGGKDAVNLRVAEQYVKEFGKLASESTTMIIPSNLGDVGGMVASLGKLLQTGKGQ